MSSRIWKILKHTVIAVLSLAVLFLVLNLFLTGRLERYLKRELIERTANATDGFYRLSFDKLSISFFKGELRLEGVSLEPDSKVFEHWAALDSLPDIWQVWLLCSVPVNRGLMEQTFGFAVSLLSMAQGVH